MAAEYQSSNTSTYSHFDLGLLRPPHCANKAGNEQERPSSGSIKGPEEGNLNVPYSQAYSEGKSHSGCQDSALVLQYEIEQWCKCDSESWKIFGF